MCGMRPTVYSLTFSCESAKEIWDYVKRLHMRWKKTRYEPVEFNKGIWIANDEEISKPIKDYSYRLVDIVNKMRLLDTKFKDSSTKLKAKVIIQGKITHLVNIVEEKVIVQLNVGRHQMHNARYSISLSWSCD